MIRASTIDELAPLVAMCREGKLFAVQEWIQQRRPVALPEDAGAKGVRRNPLRIAIDSGFHSLVQVLLEAGAPQHVRGYRALDHAVDLRRSDLAELLFKHGARVEDVSMRFVLETWSPEMMALFLSHGASLERGRPVAWALIAKIRSVLGLLKREVGTSPDLQAQAAIALRYHANEGNTKWVSLLLWAGADPCERGIYRLEDLENEQEEEEEPDEDDEPPNAVELAVMAGKLEILKLPRMKGASRPPHQPAGRLLEHACYHSDLELLSFLFAQGHLPNSLPDRGTRALNQFLHYMTFDPSLYTRFRDPKPSPIDSSHARARMKAVHLMLAHGAMWLPKDGREIGDVRRSLLKMAPGYLLEFVWLLRAYRAARRRDVLELFRTPSVNRHLGDKRATAEQMLADFPEEAVAATTASEGNSVRD